MADDLTDLLFADQGLEEFLAVATADHPFIELLRCASRERKEGDLPGARQRIEEALALPGLEARAMLLGWTALRELGAELTAAAAARLFGVVIEVPVDELLDTLAIYGDGSVRYFNQGELAILHDGFGSPLDDELRAVIVAAERVLDSAPLDDRRQPRLAGSVRILWLTGGGTHLVELPIGTIDRGPFGELFRASAQLLESLVHAASHSKV